MAKRQLDREPITKTKRICINEYDTIQKVIVRNDTSPYVYTNIAASYVKIGHMVYMAKPFDKSWVQQSKPYDNVDELIGLSINQYNDVSRHIFNSSRDEKIIVSTFNSMDVE